MLEKQLYVINKLGLHARAAAKLVGCAFVARSPLINKEKRLMPKVSWPS